MGLNPLFWQGKSVLVTGHTGFKGTWLTFLLKDLGAEVIGLSLSAGASQSLYGAARSHELLLSESFQDIRGEDGVEKVLQEAKPDYVFHLAAQAYVRRSYRHPLESITTNVTGTANVLFSSLAQKNVQGVTVATTDKVYENKEWVYPYRETDRLGGYDPYSSSKAACELAIDSYRRSFFEKHAQQCK